MKKFFIIFIIIIISIGGATFFLYKQGALDKWTEDGALLYKWQLKLFPDSPVALNNLATIIREKQGFDIILKEYQAILTLQAKGGEIDEAKAAQTKQIVENVFKMYAKAIELDPNYLTPHFNLGLMYEQLGQKELAFEHYLKVVEQNPNNMDARFRVGLLFLEAKKFEQAIQVFSKILKDDAENEDMYIKLIQFYNEYLIIDPENEKLKWARRDVVEAYTTLINQREPKALSFYNLGYIYTQIGNIQRAESAYQMALDIDPNHAKTLYNLGNIRKRQGRTQEAIKLYQRVIQSDPKLSGAYLNLGIIYGAMGNMDKAKETYLKGIQLDTENDRLYFNLGYIQEVTGFLRDAVNSYQKAHEINPKNAEAYYNKGNVYYNLGSLPEAITSYEGALKINPNHANAAVNLCISSVEARQFKQAVGRCDDAMILGFQIPPEVDQILSKYR